jgi:hypothetical protein
MKIVPAFAIIAIIWILAQSAMSVSSVGKDTRAGLWLAGWVLAAASAFYLAWGACNRSPRDEA